MVTGMRNTTQLKIVNVERVRRAIKENPDSTKAMIASVTGLSIATCNSILNEMLDDEEILISEKNMNSGGRPANLFSYNRNYQHGLGLYVSNEDNNHRLSYAVCDALGTIIEEETEAHDVIDASTIDEKISTLLHRFSKIRGIGIGVPGEVQDGTIHMCDIEALRGVDLMEQLKAKYSCSFVIENDMDFITLGYYQDLLSKQQIDKNDNLAVIYFSKEHLPGCGVVIGGNLLKGNTMFAGEISYISKAYGIPRKAQVELMNSPETVADYAAKAIISVIALLDPKIIVLFGEVIKGVNRESIENKCLEIIPEKNMSSLVVGENIHAHYMKGLIDITINSMGVELQLL